MKSQSLFALGLLAVIGFVGCLKGPPDHGTRLTVAPTNAVPTADQQQALARTAETLRQRLRDLAIRRAQVEHGADGRLIVTLPELPPERLARCRRAIETAGFLEFRVVHPESDALIAARILEPSYEVMTLRPKTPGGPSIAKFLVNKQPERGLTGEYLSKAWVLRNTTTKNPEIHFEFDPAGSALLEQVTKEYGPRNGKYFFLAIVFDGQLLCAPRIQSAITAGSAVISGDFTAKEALEVVAALLNPLEVPLRIVDEASF